MRIAVDCRSIHRSMGGIGRAALELVSAMAKDPRSHQVVIIVGPEHDSRLPFETAEVVTTDGAMIDERFEQLYLPSLLETLKADVYLNSTFSIPAVKTTRYQLAIVHDVVFEDHPEYVEPRLGDYLRRWSRFTAGNADRVLTVSDHARDRIQAVYNVEPSRIIRVYNGISAYSFMAPAEQEIPEIRRKFGLLEPFLLYVGTLEIKKGIPELLRAFANLIRSGFGGLLVLAGAKGGPTFAVEEEIRRAGLEGRVRLLGYIDERDRKPLLMASTLFVYPSLYEGFGLPPLEAMALGVPCVVSDRTSLPEVTGNAALVAQVDDPDSFSHVLKKGLEDQSFRFSARQAGPARAKEFRWEKSAHQVLDLCEALGAA